MEDSIFIRGARMHNLKNVSLTLPHNQLTVVTGVSGSGKSSLVFDTVYAEGQRRYVESLSAYARQFLDRMEKPEVDEILGLAPPIAIRQKNTTRNPRSTVATSTEVYDFLRLLFARAGTTFCSQCGQEVKKDTVDVVAKAMAAETPGSRWYALFPVAAGGKDAAQLRDHLFELRRKGFNRLYQGGTVFEFSTPESLLDIDFAKPLFVLADRLSINDSAEMRSRLADTVETCYREAGEVLFEQAGVPNPPVRLFNEKFACKTCQITYQQPEPQLFSFNNPVGACPRCQGFGNVIDYDMDLVIPDASLSVSTGAVQPWTKPAYHGWQSRFVKLYGKSVRCDVPVAEWKRTERDILLNYIRNVFFPELEEKKYKVQVRVFLSRYRGYAECADCQGSRLRKEALNVRVGGLTMSELVRKNIAEAFEFFAGLALGPEQTAIAGKVLVEIRQRLQFLNDVGLEYLTLDRLSATLSGGEAQRIQLATCLGSRLVGACYVLDEPSIGLHSRDTERLVKILHELRDLGNTILTVEHDPDVMRAADHIVDLGPGAGENGGKVVFAGSFTELQGEANTSLTGRYLRKEMETSPKLARRPVQPKKTIRIVGARANNLKFVDVTIPLHMMVAVTGVSGSGKSSLVHEVIYRALQQELNREGRPMEDESEASGSAERQTWKTLERAHLLHQVVLVDQSPIGRTPRSNPVTYVKAFDAIRELFASTQESDRRGYTAGHFSFNVPGGRCETCQGDGTVTVEMQFLADVELVCEDCKGTRYKQSILDVKYKGLNVHQVLQLTIAEALRFFHETPKLVNKLKVLQDVGLGYLRLGQSATTLSGGEAQRVKLASHLAQSSSDGTLFLFDEPTTGLHFDDIRKLLDAFQRLIHNGGSILLIEHNMEVIKAADWVIDLGPEGGSGGGLILGAGTPEEIAGIEGSYTGQFLRAELEPAAVPPATVTSAPARKRKQRA
ncbi:MAG TPA: excinuclease ABC subunit UvrA [Bryobacteraceae bacterium]|nr:excinuclease ABC subunit UvrA [Bryobacteraceae bacterium]